jgi:hypothetical protein
MFWFGKKRKRPEQLHVPKVTFVCEQDGAPERNLKQKFIPVFEERDYIHSAYLVKVTYANPNEINVALCIKMEKDDDSGLRKAIGDIFAAMFNQKEHLDTIFIGNEQEEEIKRVCRPFYEKKR